MKRFLLSLVLLLTIGAGCARAAVAVDNVGASKGGTSVTSLTITSFAVGTGANRFIWLGVSQWAATDRVPSATFNTSENFVVVDATTVAEAGTRRVTILKLINPSNVTADIVVSWAGTVDEAVIGADSWTGVDPTTPVGTAVKNSGSGTSSTVSVTGTVGDVVHDAISADGAGSPGVTANQTQRWRAIAAATTSEGAGQSASGSGAATSMTWTNINGGGGGTFAQIGAAIKQFSGGAPACTDSHMLGVWRCDEER